MIQLFNNDVDKLKVRFAENDHIVGGQVGQIGANNILLSNLRSQMLGYNTKVSDLNTDDTIVVAADNMFIHFFVKKISGNPIVKLGTASGLDDIWPAREITAIDGLSLNWPVISETTFYLGITGGTVDFIALTIKLF